MVKQNLIKELEFVKDGENLFVKKGVISTN